MRYFAEQGCLQPDPEGFAMAITDYSARNFRRLFLAVCAGLFSLGAVAASPALAAPPAAKVDDRGSEADQRACTPDVFRLCMSEIPNEPRIVACLVRSKPRLSPACRSVFDRASRTTRHANASPRNAAARKVTTRKSAKAARVKTARVIRR
jgi:hypothetical protein